MNQPTKTPPKISDRDGRKKKAAPSNYVDNEKLVQDLVLYRKAFLEAKEKGELRPKMPESIGKAIFDVANNFAKYFRFRNYSFRDEMISDAIENCVKYVHNFDVERAKANNPNAKPNAFAYISKICSFAYIRRISVEKKEMQGKAEMIRNSGILDMVSDVQSGDDSTYMNQFMKYLQEQVDNRSLGDDEEDSNGQPIAKKKKPVDPMHQLKSRNWKKRETSDAAQQSTENNMK